MVSIQSAVHGRELVEDLFEFTIKRGVPLSDLMQGVYEALNHSDAVTDIMVDSDIERVLGLIKEANEIIKNNEG